MIQVVCTLDDGRELTALTTDSSDRAATIAHNMHTSNHYTDIFVVIGNKRFAYSAFINQLEKI